MTDRSAEKKKWELTKEAFDTLLQRLDPDEDEAARKYEAIRLRLCKLFEFRGSLTPEDDADTTINRVARRLGEGVDILAADPYAYFHGVAMRVLQETFRRQAAEPKLPPPEQLPEDVEERELRLAALEACLAAMTPENRALIVSYHEGEGRARIDRRKRIAESMNIPLNALRIRTHRLREQLEACMESRLGGSGRR